MSEAWGRMGSPCIQEGGLERMPSAHKPQSRLHGHLLHWSFPTQSQTRDEPTSCPGSAFGNKRGHLQALVLLVFSRHCDLGVNHRQDLLF